MKEFEEELKQKRIIKANQSIGGIDNKCNLCGEELTAEEEINHDNRCQDCFEEWGNEWPDRI